MALKVGINGFGRIGRLVFRAALDSGEIDIVGINDLFDPESLAYLLKYDSVHGRFNGSIAAESDSIVVEGNRIPIFSEKDPADLPWGDLDTDYVVESTGLFTKHDDAIKHVHAGAKKTIISAPTKSPDQVPTIVMGVNEQSLDKSAKVLCNASCTTNCLAPIAKVIHEKFGLEEGLMTTVHAATANQPTHDSPSKKEVRQGRASFTNVIPASTGAAKAVGLAMPELKGKLTGMAFRCPVLDGSVVDLTFHTAKSTSYQEICEAMKEAAEGPMHGYLAYTDDPVVSSDFIHDPHSSTFDAGAGLELNDKFFKVVSWYDNEWGYSNRIVDLLRHVGDVDGLG